MMRTIVVWLGAAFMAGIPSVVGGQPASFQPIVPASTMAGETPSCTSWGANRLDCLVRGTDGSMYHAWSDGHQWAGWEVLGGLLESRPSCVSWGANRIDCVARGIDGAMYHAWWDGKQWTGWKSLGGVFSAANPTCMSRSFNTLDCFARGNDGAMYHDWWDSAKWHGWESIGGVFATADPTCVSWGGNSRLDCFARGNDRALYHKWWDGNRWNGWESLGGALTSNPSCVPWGTNRLDCFVRATDNSLYHRRWDGARWAAWEGLGGILTSDPSCVSWGPNHIDCFVRAADNSLYHRRWDGTRWAAWEGLGGVLASNPSCVSWGANRLDCFAQGTDSNVYHRWWNGAQWLGWEALGRVVLMRDRTAHSPDFILATTYKNPPFDTSKQAWPHWAKELVHGKTMFPGKLDVNVIPIINTRELTNPEYAKNEWTQILSPDEDYEVDVVGLSGRAIIYDVDGKNGQSGNDVPFTHPFGSDWEFYIAPDDAYRHLAAPPAPPPDTHDEYRESVIEAKRDFGLDVVNTLGVEIEQDLMPLAYRVKHGDRVAIWGRWIVDTGHPDFHTEIHPPLLLAAARATSPDETTTTVIGRPYLTGQRWPGGPGNNFSLGMMDHLLEEADKVPLNSTRVEAHPTIMPKAWQGLYSMSYTVRPPTPRGGAGGRTAGGAAGAPDRLMVSFHFTVRTGVSVQVVNSGDAVTVTIVMNGNLNQRAALPPKHEYTVTKTMLADMDSRAGTLWTMKEIKRGAETLGVGAAILAKGILTDRYDPPYPHSSHDSEIVHVPVDSLSGNTPYSVDDSQPFPIYGKLTLAWEREVAPGNVPTNR